MFKQIQLEAKAVDLKGSTFEGNSAGLGNRDDINDEIDPGAFAKSIQERVPAGKVKLINGHAAEDTRNVWGKVVEAEEREFTGRQPKPPGVKRSEFPSHVIWTKFEVSRTDADAQTALKKVDEGILDALSIGFKPVKVEYIALDAEGNETDGFDGDSDPMWEWWMGRAVRHIKELAWWETSLVTWGANSFALILPGTVKALNALAEQAMRGLPVDEAHVKRALVALDQALREGKAPEVLDCALRAQGGARLKFGQQLDILVDGAIPEQDQEAVFGILDGLQARAAGVSRETFVSYVAHLAESAAEGLPAVEPQPKRPSGAICYDVVHPDGAIMAKGRIWNAAAERRRLKGDLLLGHAWVDDAADPELVRSYRYLHHHEGNGEVSRVACLSALEQLNGEVDQADREGIYTHLSRHLAEDCGMDRAEIPALKEHNQTHQAAPEPSTGAGEPTGGDHSSREDHEHLETELELVRTMRSRAIA